MPSVPRPRTQTVRLTEEQHQLLHARLDAEPGRTIQKVLAAAVNAYVRGDFRVNARGEYEIGPAPKGKRAEDVISFEDDGEALDLDDLDSLLVTDSGHAAPDPTPRMLGTREIAELAEEHTGRAVPVPLLRRLLRERWPKPEGSHAQTRYRWPEDDPRIWEIVQLVSDGALDELRKSAITEARSRRRS